MTDSLPKAEVDPRSAPTSLLADQQKKRSDANQHRNQNTDNERNNPMPKLALTSFDPAPFCAAPIPNQNRSLSMAITPSSALLCSGLTMLATTVNLPARRAPSPQIRPR